MLSFPEPEPGALPERRNFALASLLIPVCYGITVWAMPYVSFYHGIWCIPASTAGITDALVPLASVLTSALFFGAAVISTGLKAAGRIVAFIVITEMKFRRRGLAKPIKS